ncbi:hypothetical protein ACWT_8086 [Actinoplanes sp. SE50]|nr:hypothetical protein ACPL_8217 [Actinoplanes sp. SE50/110]ATO87501.1 hypothetical protein ACWT_8086 [Actinoplanes sp. SE50]SLM04919.1 hypothetical protein ACSP50_8231 [Actinoplanes sp. SE50/110]
MPRATTLLSTFTALVAEVGGPIARTPYAALDCSAPDRP